MARKDRGKKKVSYARKIDAEAKSTKDRSLRVSTKFPTPPKNKSRNKKQ